MNLTLLRTFVTVHRSGSFTRAAQLLGLTQPTVTGQIRSLERQIGRPLFVRLPRGVTPTTVGDELAHKVAPHLDALSKITETDLHDGTPRTLHLAGPRDFTARRVLPALAPLAAAGFALRVSLGTAEENLNGLIAAQHDLIISTGRARRRQLTSTTLCDEENVLVSTPSWAERLAVRPNGEETSRSLERAPVVDYDEDLPLLTGYWSTVFDTKPSVAGAVIVPDLRAVLHSVRAGAGIAVLPRYLCSADLDTGTLVPLLQPPVPPLRTFFVTIRAGTLSQWHIARAHEQLLRAASEW